MNLTAALVWGHVDGKRTLDELTSVVWNAYGQTPDPERIALEVRQVLRDFETRGLLEPQGTLQ